MSSSLFGVLTWLGHKETFVENGRRSDDWNLDEHGFCLLEDMPMPVAEKDLTQHAGFECREHPVLFGFHNERPQLLTPEAKEPSFGLDQWLVYYSHVAKAAKKVLPEAEYVIITGHSTFSAELSPFRQVAYALRSCFLGALRLLGTEETPPMGAMPDFIHADHTVEQGAHLLSTALESFNGLELGGRRVVSVNFWRNARAEARASVQPVGAPGQFQVPNREVLYGPPPALTSGLPDPTSVERQKENYLTSLEEQEQRSNASLELQRKQQLELIHSQAEQQKKRLFMQIDQQVKTQEMALTQQYNQQLLQLNQQYHQQKAALEQQAMQLTMEYQQQRMQEEMAKKQAELQKEHSEVQARFHQDLQKLQQPGQVQEPMGPAGAVPGVYQHMQAPCGGSWVPPPMPNGGAYMPPALAPSGLGGSYVPPVAAPMGHGASPGGGSYVPPPANYVAPDMLQVSSGGGSYVPPPNMGAGGNLPGTVMQPQVPNYAAGTMPGYAAPPTSYGPVPGVPASYGTTSTPGTSYPPVTSVAQ